MFTNEQNNTHQLKLSSLHLRSFRNYSELQLSNLGPTTIFIGPNAVGKTTILEAIQLMTALTSFRTSKPSQCIQWGSGRSSITAHITSSLRDITTELNLYEGKKQYLFNGKPKRVKDLQGLLPAVVFTPDDLLLVKGANSKRLASFDDIGAQLSKNFYTVRSDFQKLLRQKNQALKDELPLPVIQSINEVFAKVAAQYISHRMTLLGIFTPVFSEMYAGITNNQEQAQISYAFSWGEKVSFTALQDYDRTSLTQDITKFLASSLSEEQARKKSVIGPQSDTFNFLIAHTSEDFSNAQIYASQGQQRSVALAYKMAEIRTIQKLLQQRPVLLLDDVMSELDEYRRESFLQFLTDDTQTFITTTNSGYFTSDTLQHATIYELPFTS